MANEKRLIYLEDAYEAVTDLSGQAETKSAYAAFWKAGNELKKLPTVDAAPVVHGWWEAIPDNRTFLRCSVCHDSHIYADWDYDSGPMWYYCPNCGARMDGERRTET